jgi:hypothetical protein
MVVRVITLPPSRLRRLALAGALPFVLAAAGCAGPASVPPPQIAATAPAAIAPMDEPMVSECVPFARAQSGIEIYGNAADWWWKADGRYPRSSEPAPGSVLVFGRSPRLAHGHVAVVTEVVSDREIRVAHANWVRHLVTRHAPVWDVSAANDWSLVRVWWPPSRQMGATAYPTEGFIRAGVPLAAAK